MTLLGASSLTTEKNPSRNDECKICGAKNLDIFAHTARCMDCGVLLYYPYPADDSVLMHENSGKSSWKRKDVLFWYSSFSFYNHDNFTYMTKFVMDNTFKGRDLSILDYGGGGGQFALVCKSLFPQCNVHITDISDESLLAEWSSLNTQIPFNEFESDTRKFDVVFMNDVFEHLSDPECVLEVLHGKLKTNGLVFIDTPKQFWIYPATKMVSKSLYTKVLKGTVSSAHLQIWSKRSFAHVVEKTNFKIAKYTEISEYTMPASSYLEGMGITNPLIRAIGHIFYRNSKWLAKNKIVSVLSPK